MHEAALAQAAFPGPAFILGLRLLPYSLGHELRLIREDNPLHGARPERDPDPAITWDHVYQAGLICCQTVEQCDAMARDFWIETKLSLWYWRTRSLRRRPGQLKLEVRAFAAYREMGSLDFPRAEGVRPSSSAAPSRAAGAPFLIRLHQFLMTTLRKTDEEAWNFPFGLAKMHWLTYWEQEGGVDIKNHHDSEFEEYQRGEGREHLRSLGVEIPEEDQCPA